jgi:hypothetical protein
MMNTMNQKKSPELMPTLLKSALVGGVGGVAGAYMFGNSGTLPFLGYDVSVPMALGGAIGAASFLGEYAAPMVLGMLPQSSGAVAAESMMVKPALTAAAAYLTVSMLVGTVERPVQLMLLGAGSEVAGTYAYGTVAPLLGWGSSAEAPAVATF